MAREVGRLGRPTKSPPAGQRASLGLKVTAAIKQRLDLAARANGRTQSQEAETRLEASFRGEDMLTEMLGLAYGPHTAGLLRYLGPVVKQLADIHSGMAFAARQPAAASGEWLNQPWCRHQVAEALREFADELNPPDEATPQLLAPPHLNKQEADALAKAGRASAQAFLHAVLDPRSNENLGRSMKPARDLWAGAIDERWSKGRKERSDAR
jgi:hypothetical protein